MKHLATILLSLFALSATSQCVSDTTYYSQMYDYVLCVDNSLEYEQLELSSTPDILSIKTTVRPAVVLRYVGCSVMTVETTCGEEKYTASQLIIPGRHNLEPIDWRPYSEWSVTTPAAFQYVNQEEE